MTYRQVVSSEKKKTRRLSIDSLPQVGLAHDFLQREFSDFKVWSREAVTRYRPAWILSKPLLPPATHRRGRHLFSSRLLAPFLSTCNLQFLLSIPPDALPRSPKPHTSRLAREKVILRRSSPRSSFRLNSSCSVNYFEIVRAAGLHIPVSRIQEPLRTRRRSSSWTVGTRSSLWRCEHNWSVWHRLKLSLSNCQRLTISLTLSAPIGFHSKPYAKTHSSPP